MSDLNIFDRKLLRINRDRASKNLGQFNFLFTDAADRIIEKVTDFNQSFNNILEVGARDGFLGKQLFNLKKSSFLVQSDCSFLMAKSINSTNVLVADDQLLCFKPESFDLIVSNCNLHFINDLPGFLVQIKSLLKEKGLFIASFFGGVTLQQLRQAFYRSELEYYNAVSPRIIPFVDVKSAGMLMRSAGFKNCISEREDIVVSYQDPLNLLKDIKNMGEANIMFKRSKKFVTGSFLKLLNSLYGDHDSNIDANFELITVSGWN